MLKCNSNPDFTSVKTLFRSVFYLLMLTIFVCSCKTDTTENPDGQKPVEPKVVASSSQLTGIVKSMTTKQPIAGTSILVINDDRSVTLLTDTDGSFIISYNPSLPIDAMYTKTNYEPLHQKYDEFQSVKEIIIYLEDLTTPPGTSKKIHGLTMKKKTSSGSATIPVKDVEVSELPGGDSMKSEGNGDYGLSFTDRTPTFKYQFKISNTLITAEVKNLSAIKDSTQIDMVLSTNAVGIEINDDKE